MTARFQVAALAVLALAGQLSAQESSPPNQAPGIKDRPAASPPTGPGRKGTVPHTDTGTAPNSDPRATPRNAPTQNGQPLPGETAPAVRNDPRARREQEDWRQTHPGDGYRYGVDAEHRLVFATCLDATSHAQMLRMLETQADQQAATLFDALPDSEIFIAVATPADIKKMFADTPATAGMYEHPLRRIITADIGTVLRHEWTHAMHFGHMERLGQPHMMWVQEGLAALYENYQISTDGTLRFLPSARHNFARKTAANKRALALADVLVMNPDEFMAKSQTLYPVVRSIFEFMADEGKLRPWYRKYVENFATDRTGKLAIEATFRMTLPEFEAAWRKWVLARPAVDLAVKAGDRVVGIEVRAAADGVEVTRVARGSAAETAGIKVGDVITAIAGQPIRSPREWTQATASIRVPELDVSVRSKDVRRELTLMFDRQVLLIPARNGGIHALVSSAIFWGKIAEDFLDTAPIAMEG